MTEMDITYIFIRYISVIIRRQARAFYYKYDRVFYYENKEFIENIEIENETSESSLNQPSTFYRNIEEKLSYQELLLEGLNLLDDTEKKIIFDKFLKQRSDADIGKEYSVSSQMISKKKRKILGKLKSFFPA
ncbi:sigma-70 family RNA polymerase sigma factor [Enterococcus sp. ALS3]|uniref:Sigma-70 family RNA polymerase sigma factor n=1 Tax=Enterococcus alishanensis TaxID=1303817 RepID=A0ABS6T9R6_9ENTE|nr:sigma-70 family RNA polymerase sigma factor [Enterococcus alishanensis]MBV7389639.1 sigma-70 family RNA polymerase sigma factor [Enterococcus alishanensis]